MLLRQITTRKLYLTYQVNLISFPGWSIAPSIKLSPNRLSPLPLNMLITGGNFYILGLRYVPIASKALVPPLESSDVALSMFTKGRERFTQEIPRHQTRTSGGTKEGVWDSHGEGKLQVRARGTTPAGGFGNGVRRSDADG